jgi:hypothetical protein
MNITIFVPTVAELEMIADIERMLEQLSYLGSLNSYLLQRIDYPKQQDDRDWFIIDEMRSYSRFVGGERLEDLHEKVKQLLAESIARDEKRPSSPPVFSW